MTSFASNFISFDNIFIDIPDSPVTAEEDAELGVWQLHEIPRRFCLIY